MEIVVPQAVDETQVISMLEDQALESPLYPRHI